MSVPVDLPPETLRRLEAEAARRGVDIDVVIADLADTLPSSDRSRTSQRRDLAIAGIGASGGAPSARDADDLLAEGFGRS